MNRSRVISALVAALYFPAVALASDGDDARSQVLAALESQAQLPEHRPTLPDTASDRAREVHETIAFGKNGAAQKAAHSAADHSAGHAARDAADRAANRAAEHGQSAANAKRADEKRTGKPPAPPGRNKP